MSSTLNSADDRAIALIEAAFADSGDFATTHALAVDALKTGARREMVVNLARTAALLGAGLTEPQRQSIFDQVRS